jgi:hypothetical protein
MSYTTYFYTHVYGSILSLVILSPSYIGVVIFQLIMFQKVGWFVVHSTENFSRQR